MQRQYFADRDCRDRCDASSNCTGYNLPVNGSANWCETYTSAGASGDGRADFKCYMKGIDIRNVHFTT